VTDCQVALAAHQVRIHTSSGSSVFLDVGSNPVIEHCSAMGLGALTPQQRQLLGISESPAVPTEAAGTSAAGCEQTDSGSVGTGAIDQPQPTCAAAGAAGSGGSSCWRAVQDFNWLRSTPSPNWWALADFLHAATSYMQPAFKTTNTGAACHRLIHCSSITSASRSMSHICSTLTCAQTLQLTSNRAHAGMC
jgi:Tubulin binding cofactor C